jgi:hypothetical protein
MELFSLAKVVELSGKNCFDVFGIGRIYKPQSWNTNLLFSPGKRENNRESVGFRFIHGLPEEFQVKVSPVVLGVSCPIRRERIHR